MLDWLKTILGDAYTDDIDKKVSEEIGKNFVARTDFNSVNAEKKALADTVKERDQQLETLKAATGNVDELKAQIATLQTENADAAKKHEAELKSLKVDTAVDLALAGAKAKNVKAVKALLNLDNAELAEDGTVKGLAEQIKKLSESPDSSFMFESKSQNFNGLKPNEKGDPNSGAGMTLEKLRKMSPSERFEFSLKNPDEYKELYGGTK